MLLAHSKTDFYRQLLGSPVLDEAYLLNELHSYFPTAIAESFSDSIESHRLRRELIATHITNDMINRMGLSFSARIQEHSGADAGEIACVYLAIREIFNLRTLWREIEALDNSVPAAAQLQLLNETRKLCNRLALWLLRHHPAPTAIADIIADFGPGAGQLRHHLADNLSAEDGARLDETTQAYTEQGIPTAVARQVAMLPYLFSSLDILSVAGNTGRDPVYVARLYQRLGADLELHWLRDAITALPQDDHWSRLARSSLRDDQYRLQGQLSEQILAIATGPETTEGLLTLWHEQHSAAIDRFQQRMDEFKSTNADLALISVALNEVRKLLHRTSEVN